MENIFVLAMQHGCHAKPPFRTFVRLFFTKAYTVKPRYNEGPEDWQNVSYSEILMIGKLHAVLRGH